MHVIVVSSDVEERWAVVGALALDPAVAMSPEVATARLAHPASRPAEAVVLCIHGGPDLMWLDWHRSNATRPGVPVVALVEDEALIAPAHAAGADAVVTLEGPAELLVTSLRLAVADVTTPRVVRDVDGAPVPHSA